jgi:hypothetical protein
VERLTNADRACAVAAAAAQDLNDELTVILSSVTTSIHMLEPGHPARRYLFDLEGAALRSASKVSKLQRFTTRSGARAIRTALDALLVE